MGERMNLGKLIKAYMDQEQKSVRDMAREIGCSPTTLFRMIKGKSVQQAMVHRVYLWILSPTNQSKT